MATTITVPESTKERLDEYRDDGQTWGEFLEYLLDEVQAYAEDAEEMADLTALGARVMYGETEHLEVVAERLERLERNQEDILAANQGVSTEVQGLEDEVYEVERLVDSLPERTADEMQTRMR